MRYAQEINASYSFTWPHLSPPLKGSVSSRLSLVKLIKSQPSITYQETDIHGSYYVHLKNGFGGNNKRNVEYSGI